jgi:Arm DNA-binding domain
MTTASEPDCETDQGGQAPHPSGKQTLFWDTELKGFGVLVSGTTTGKTYVVQHTLKGGNTRRLTIGPCNAIELEGADGARARAKALIALFCSGIDPKAEERKERD